MGQKEMGQAYFNTLSAIKDKIASNIAEESGRLGLSREQISRLIFVSQASVDDVGGSAFTSLTKSVS